MHELSIVENIISIANETTQSHHGKTVDSIELDIGQLAGIEMGAFDFAWDIATQNTVLENAERKINRMSGRAQCLLCNTEFNIKQYLDFCPNCGSYQKEILSGNDLKVKRITLS